MKTTRPAVGRPFRVRGDVRLALRVAYAIVIALATLTQLGEVPEQRQPLEQRLEGVFDVPAGGRAAVDFVRNVVLFAGWGAVWVITEPPGPGRPMLARAVGTGLLLSFGAEVLQLAAPRRDPSALDVLANVAGAVTGAGVMLAALLLLRAALGARSFIGVPALLFAAGYSCAAFLEGFSPIFRQQRLPNAWGTPMDRLRAALADVDAGSLSVLPWLDLVLFLPAGFFTVAALVEMNAGYGAALLVTVAGGIALSVLAELGRGLIGHPIHLGPILIHACAISLGAWAAYRWLPSLSRSLRGAARPLALYAAYALLLVLWTLRPFYPEWSLRRIADKLAFQRLLPLYAYRERVDVFSAVDALLPVLLLVPLGALLAVWPLRRHGRLRGLLPALYLVAGLEAAQLLIAGRWFDTTDVLIHASALALGWAMVRRAGYATYGEAWSAAAATSTDDRGR